MIERKVRHSRRKKILGVVGGELQYENAARQSVVRFRDYVIAVFLPFQ